MPGVISHTFSHQDSLSHFPGYWQKDMRFLGHLITYGYHRSQSNSLSLFSETRFPRGKVMRHRCFLPSWWAGLQNIETIKPMALLEKRPTTSPEWETILLLPWNSSPLPTWDYLCLPRILAYRSILWRQSWKNWLMTSLFIQ